MSTHLLSDEGIKILKTYIQINDDNSSLRNSLFEQLQKTFTNLKILKKAKKYVCSLICNSFPAELYKQHVICLKYPNGFIINAPFEDRKFLEIAREPKNQMKRHRLMNKIYNEIENLYVEFKIIESPVANSKVTYCYL